MVLDISDNQRVTLLSWPDDYYIGESRKQLYMHQILKVENSTTLAY